MYDNISKAREKVRIQRFCCCVDLKTGCYIIGCIGWVLTLVKIYLIVARTTVSDSSTVTYYDIEYKLCYIAITLITSAALIWGAHTLKKGFILPWLILRCFESVMMIIVTIVFFGLIFFSGEYLLYAILTFVSFFIGTGVSWYFWLCVWNFYQNVGDVSRNSIAPEMMDGIDKENHMG